MKTKPILMALAVVVIFALISFIWIPLPSGWIPQQAPSEDRRVVHPLGFSIVKPPGWFVKVFREESVYGEASINLLATDKKIRFYPRLKVAAWKSSPDFLSKYHETIFLGMKAYQKIDLRAGRGDYFTYQLFITNQNRWYELIYQIPADCTRPSITNIPTAMMPYLQSFKPVP